MLSTTEALVLSITDLALFAALLAFVLAAHWADNFAGRLRSGFVVVAAFAVVKAVIKTVLSVVRLSRSAHLVLALCATCLTNIDDFGLLALAYTLLGHLVPGVRFRVRAKLSMILLGFGIWSLALTLSIAAFFTNLPLLGKLALDEFC
ncbi:hypothetical protein NpPPO83_00001081 [Neofusicoccum parvum]|uniref:Uncharacterized protein n=1 Tax=Neofusicoccum parvum TaxID=310453 RepID=A0ACB5SK15_9PEZI|nr:hypothetical protein NpPPO83_00001081 [Neofusicoccum parvum]